MDNLVGQLQDVFEGPIDFEGQRLVEMICTVLLSITAAVAFIVGYIRQDIYLTLGIGLVGSVVTAVVVVPPWPAYNKHPEAWVRPGKGGMARTDIVVGGRKIQ